MKFINHLLCSSIMLSSCIVSIESSAATKTKSSVGASSSSAVASRHSGGAGNANTEASELAEAPAPIEDVKSKSLRFNDISRRIGEKKFVGGRDEESLEVQNYLFKPEKGAGAVVGARPEPVEEDHSEE